MAWLKLDPARSSMSESDFYAALQSHYLDVSIHLAGTPDWDTAAFYRSTGDGPKIYYFSPGAAQLLLPVNRFSYEVCKRPETGTVSVMVGSSLARNTAWVELPDEIRPYPDYEPELAEAEERYWRDVWGPGGECGPDQDDDQSGGAPLTVNRSIEVLKNNASPAASARAVPKFPRGAV